VAYYVGNDFVEFFQRYVQMSKALVCLTLAIVVGGILFCQFLYEIWDEKDKKNKKGDFYY